jgi:ribosomal protein RSM22 (predicted rRNA methylase)
MYLMRSNPLLRDKGYNRPEMQLPYELRDAIERVTGDAEGALARPARELSEHYRQGDFRAPVLATAAHRQAYLQVRLPATYAANRHVLAEAAGLKIESMLDLGAGPGTSMWAALESFPYINRCTLVERDSELAALGQSMAAHSSHEAVRQATWLREDLSAFRPEKHDLVVISYVLGELRAGEAERLILSAWQATEKLLAIIEPGTPRNFQYVLAARQTLIAAGAQVAAPCPHHNACPMAATGDWCHFAERLERTAGHRRLKGGDLSYEDEKFSYVLASRVPVAWPQARIVRHPQFRPGHVCLTLCTADGLKRETIGKSQKEQYREARKAKWGDAIG